jgi:hypothetical protein
MEVRQEHDKQNLVHQLALQRRQSARSKFNRHQKIINSQQKVDIRRQQLEVRLYLFVCLLILKFVGRINMTSIQICF